jgi:hypothetical protein
MGGTDNFTMAEGVPLDSSSRGGRSRRNSLQVWLMPFSWSREYPSVASSFCRLSNKYRSPHDCKFAGKAPALGCDCDDICD